LRTNGYSSTGVEDRHDGCASTGQSAVVANNIVLNDAALDVIAEAARHRYAQHTATTAMMGANTKMGNAAVDANCAAAGNTAVCSDAAWFEEAHRDMIEYCPQVDAPRCLSWSVRRKQKIRDARTKRDQSAVEYLMRSAAEPLCCTSTVQWDKSIATADSGVVSFGPESCPAASPTTKVPSLFSTPPQTSQGNSAEPFAAGPPGPPCAAGIVQAMVRDHPRMVSLRARVREADHRKGPSKSRMVSLEHDGASVRTLKCLQRNNEARERQLCVTLDCVGIRTDAQRSVSGLSAAAS